MPAIADCSDPSSPYVDGYGCDLRDRDFGFADLRNAILIQVDLTGANVTGTNFGARTSAEGRILRVYGRGRECDETLARLAEAIWINGRTCAAGSHGDCE